MSNTKPLDPTRSADDFIGDTTGMTGVTTGSAQATSSTPHDLPKDQNKDHLPGGLGAGSNSQGITNVSDDLATPQTMSAVAQQAAEDIGSEDNDSDADVTKSRMYRLPHDIVGQQSDANTTDAADSQPENQGEQSVSGTSPDPESDDDTLANAQAVGMQLGEDEEHPQEVDIARDIDAAEQALRDQ